MSEKIDNLTIVKRGIKDKVKLIEVTGITGSALAYLLSQLLTEIVHPCLIILPNSEEAGRFYKDLDFFLSNQNELILQYAQKDTMCLLFAMHIPLLCKGSHIF